MPALQQIDPTKAPPAAAAKSHSEEQPGNLTQANPHWQSIALNPKSIQTKLRVSQPGDAHEQEADRVAADAMRAPDAPSSNNKLSLSPGSSSKAQRKSEHRERDEEKELRRKEQDGKMDSPAFAPPIVHEALNSPGQLMDPDTRAFMESRLGHDFGDVRVHAGGKAASAARAIEARAYTVGHDIVFGAGEYAPATSAGQKLIAHELAHAAQQGARAIPSGRLAVNSPHAGAEREAKAASGFALAGQRASISPHSPAVARAPVSDYGGTEQLEITRPDMEVAKSNVPGLNRLDEVYAVSLVKPLASRFATQAEERDAVFDVAWQIRPATVSAVVEKLVSIPARGSSAAVFYQFTFTPKDPKDKKAKDKLTIEFKEEGPGAALVTPPTVAGATRPKGLSGSGFPGNDSRAYFATHADEALQLYGWIAAQKADEYDQLLVTSESTGAGSAAKKHESTLRVAKAKGEPDINADLLGEFRLDEKRPAANYRRDYADDLIAKAQTKGDPGQTTKPDKLGAVTGIAAFPADEQFSVKFFAYSLFETTKKGGKTSAGLRDAESKGVVNVAGSTKSVLVRVSIGPNATTKLHDMDVQRIGELGKGVEIDPAKAKPDVGRAVGFPTTAKDAAPVIAFLKKRYKALAGVTGKDAVAVRGAANALLESDAKTAAYFSKNYAVSVLDPGVAATRLQDKAKLDALQTADMETFSDPELWALELAFETLSDQFISVLADTAFARQKIEIVDKGKSAKPRFMTSTEHAGKTFAGAGGSDRTVVLFDNFHDNEATSFMGSTKEGVLPIVDFTILHEMGHAVDFKTAARAAFNAKFPKLRGFTDYARHDLTKEAFEEAFAIFNGDPEWLKANHQDVFEWFTAQAAPPAPKVP